MLRRSIPRWLLGGSALRRDRITNGGWSSTGALWQKGGKSGVLSDDATTIGSPVTLDVPPPVAASAPAATGIPRKVVSAPGGPRPLRVAVLSSSYDDSSSCVAAVDTLPASPEFWMPDDPRYTWSLHMINKKNSYDTIRRLVMSGDHDVFWNLCDGARDEDRAGEDVIRALEAFNVPFTGADSRCFELSKVEMKMRVMSAGVRAPNFAVVDTNDKDIARLCRHLRFPVIFKHPSGYASVGMSKLSKCETMEELVPRVRAFVEEYQSALVEEFVTGREGTALACADPASPDGVHVFPPILLDIGDPNDFSHFDNKWVHNSFKSIDTKPKPVAIDDPAYAAIIDMCRSSYRLIMNGVGYGRVDFRIDDKLGPSFLEINANCGMLYPPGTGGCYADVSLGYDKDWNHTRFIASQIDLAMRQQQSRLLWWSLAYAPSKKFYTKSTRSVAEGILLFPDETCDVPVGAKLLFPPESIVDRHLLQVSASRRHRRRLETTGPSALNAMPSHDEAEKSRMSEFLESRKVLPNDDLVACQLSRADDMASAVAMVKHACDPNLAFVHGAATSVVASRPIRKGESLTLDYSSVRDAEMPAFLCRCGSPYCRRIILPQSPKVRQPPRSRLAPMPNSAGQSNTSALEAPTHRPPQ